MVMYRPLRRPFCPVAIALIVFAGGATHVLAQGAEKIGKAEKIENKVTGAIAGQNRALSVPDDVHRDETIRTEAKAQALIRFSDATDLRLGPQASLKLDAFVFSGKKGAAMELASGSMRFVSGNGPKGSYLIKTPVATIGLRGTTVEVTIRNGRTYVSLHEGQAQVCTRSGRCIDLTNACTYLSVDQRGVTTPQPLSNRVPTFSGACTGDICVVDACTPQLTSAPVTRPPAATPPPRATPPRATPPRSQRPPRARNPGRFIEEDIIVDEPTYGRPRRPRYPVDVYPGYPGGPGFDRPRRPRFPDGRPGGGVEPGDKPREPRRPGGGRRPPHDGDGPVIRRPRDGFDGGFRPGGRRPVTEEGVRSNRFGGNRGGFGNRGGRGGFDIR
jgi:hypothetical protein